MSTPPEPATSAPSQPIATVVADCPICGSRGPARRYVLREMLFGTRQTFEYLHCASCGVLWLAEPPEDLAAFYPPDYHVPAGVAPSVRPLRGLSGWLHDGVAAQVLFGGHGRRAALGRRFGPPLRDDVEALRDFVGQAGLRSLDDPILDVGSGPYPERLVKLRAAGFRRLLAIDPLLPADRVVDGIPVLKRTIQDVRGLFALVTFHHSFEHVPDPAEVMTAAARLVRPGGCLLIRTPVMGTWFWEHYGTSWWELDPPRHLFVHTEASLVRLASAAGLELERVVFDSSALEVLASDQIGRDIAWREPGSYWSDHGLVSPSEVSAARGLAARLNRAGQGGRAAFFFRRPR
jgi:SAM-dependent methyltransferase